jgi:hypothetical protein
MKKKRKVASLHFVRPTYKTINEKFRKRTTRVQPTLPAQPEAMQARVYESAARRRMCICSRLPPFHGRIVCNPYFPIFSPEFLNDWSLWPSISGCLQMQVIPEPACT